MTFEEARAQFPVLERYAYLQAGSVGPLARVTIDAVRAEEETGLREGRGSHARFMRLLEMREELRGGVAALVGVGAEHVALTASTTDGCNIVLAGLELGPDDEIVTTTDEHFGLLGPLHASGARVVVAARNETKSRSAVDELARYGGEPLAVTVDVASEASVEALFRTTLDRCGRVDILVNNAGRSIRRAVASSYDRFHDYERTMQLNYFGALRLIMSLLPEMRKRSKGRKGGNCSKSSRNTARAANAAGAVRRSRSGQSKRRRFIRSLRAGRPSRRCGPGDSFRRPCGRRRRSGSRSQRDRRAPGRGGCICCLCRRGFDRRSSG